MPCGSEDNCGSGITLAMCHRLCDIPTYRLSNIENEMSIQEHHSTLCLLTFYQIELICENQKLYIRERLQFDAACV